MQTFSFQSDLANMLFDTPADPTRAQYEAQLVERFREAVSMASSRDLFRRAQMIDAYLLPKLSGHGVLAVAKLMELRAPAAIEVMPRLRAIRSHAARAHELSQILSPAALMRVIEALKTADASR